MHRVQLRRLWIGSSVVILAGLLLPSTATAQSAIAGTVTDTTGGVLPGVTVEARSPALIEQVRTGVTDGSGQYRIVDLRPGEYTVTFTLPGFNTVVREGIRLEANFTAPVSAEMRVGALEETVTVSGDSPVVDVQNTQRREVLGRDLAEALPTGRSYETLARTLPAVVTAKFDVGGTTQAQQGRVTAYGGEQQDMSTLIDGMKVDSSLGRGGTNGAYMNAGAVEEYVYQLTGGTAETQTGGVNLNIISREGSNQFSGDGVVIFSNGALQSSNLSDAHRAVFGDRAVGELEHLFDYNVSVGGPIVRDKLWFFGSSRDWGYDSKVLNLFHDGTMGPAGEQVVDANLLQAYVGRLTWQAHRNHKITARQERVPKDRDYMGIENGTLRPEAAPWQHTPAGRIDQAKWTATLTSKLLVEAGLTIAYHRWISEYQIPGAPGVNDGFAGPKMPSATDPYGDIPRIEIGGSGPLAGMSYGNRVSAFNRAEPRYYSASSLSYVTGTHALKGGYQTTFRGYQDSLHYSHHNFRQRYLNGRPNSVDLFSYPFRAQEKYRDVSLYVQDSWTRDRLTINAGLRYDYFRGWIPEQIAPASQNLPERRFAEVPDIPLWHDISPRFGAAYDLVGNSKTVVKGSVGRYVWQESISFASRFQPLGADTDRRLWNDLNGNDIAEPNELGPSTNAAFGTDRRVTFPGDAAQERTYDILYNATFQHELLPGLGLTVSYNRRTNHNLYWTDNLATTFDDYTLLTVPDPRGNGEMLPVYNISRAKQAARDQLVQVSTNERTWQGFDILAHGRLGNGIIFTGGTSTGRGVATTCQVDDPNSLRFCDEGQSDIPFRTTFKLSGVYPISFVPGFSVSAVFQSVTGNEREVLYQVTRRVLPSLTLSSVSVRLNEPGSVYGDRINQLDLSLSGTIRLREVQLKPSLDLFNALNASPVLRYQDTFGATLGTPRSILDARLVRLMLRVDF